MMRGACSPFFLAVCASLFCACPFAAAETIDSEEDAPFLRSEGRTPCAEHNPLKKAYFGDLHIHTRWSLDAYMQGARMQPSDAYRFAKGESLSLPTSLTVDSQGKNSVICNLALLSMVPRPTPGKINSFCPLGADNHLLHNGNLLPEAVKL